MGYLSNITIAEWKQIDLASQADQILQVTAQKYIIKRIISTNLTGTITLAAGGVYTAANKGGTNIVSALQVYTSLLSNASFDLTLVSGISTTVLTAPFLFFSLTTKSTTPARMDLIFVGDTLD